MPAVGSLRVSRIRDLFKPRSIAGKISALIAIAILFQLFTVVYQLSEYRNALWSQRRHELQNLTALAQSIVEAEYSAARSGQRTMEEAQANARLRIGALRYNKDDYFWINDMTPKMVMHPIKPELNGQDLASYKDPNGKHLFVAFVDAVKASGSGFVDYKWPKPGSSEPQPKLSFVSGFEPWGWVIGTGVYVDDLEALFLSRLRIAGAIVLALVGFSAAVSLLLGRKIAHSISIMSDTMNHLADGDLSAPIPGQPGATELESMARALEIFKRNALEKIQLEAEAQTQLQLGEDARQRAAAQAIAEERQRVMTSFGKAMSRLAAKDLTYRVADDVPEAYRSLRDDFNTAMEALEQSLILVQSSADVIASGARQITNASDDLSQRTEQQAACLEQTSAAMVEFSGAINKTAEASTRTKDIITTAKQESSTSERIVLDAVTAVDGIKDSSQQITRIIGVIDEIAFQTNLLALNAGVEAARAGDAGRGFAVVASEVRALAQRSAEAAKEIKALLSQSASEVDAGVQLVGKTGVAISRIIEQISTIDSGIASIAAQALDQSATLKQVNTTIIEIDQTTQHNAALAEETTAACRSLSQESERLAELVAVFNLRRVVRSPSRARAA